LNGRQAPVPCRNDKNELRKLRQPQGFPARPRQAESPLALAPTLARGRDCSLTRIRQIRCMRSKTVADATAAGLYVAAELRDIGPTRFADPGEVAAAWGGLFSRHA
jgi:hypothetical protein